MAIGTLWLALQLGQNNSGQAANIRCTLTDGTGTVRVNALNAPDGTNAFAEETDAAGNAVTGSYTVRITTFDTSWLPVKVKYTVNGVVGMCVITTIGQERAIEILDGLTAALSTNLATTNTRVALALPAVAPGANGGLPTGNAANVVKTIDDLCSIADSVQASPAPAVGAFAGSTALLATDGAYLNMTLVFTSGALKGIPHKVTGYTGASRLFAFTNAFPLAPAAGDTFILVGRTE